MRVYFIVSVIFFLTQNYFAQSNLIFQKKSNKKEISVSLPASCSFLTIDHEWKEGKVFGKTDTTILYSYHFHDSLKFYEIVKNKSLSRKQKKFKTDSLYKADSTIVMVNFKDIQRMDFQVFKIKPTKYKKIMWTLLVLSQATAIVTLITVVYELVPLAQIIIPIFTVTTAGTLFGIRKRIRLTKWDIK